MSSSDQYTPEDPTTQHTASDDLPGQKIDHPGRETDMEVEPDFGESTYRGSGRLEGKRALITGGGSCIGWGGALGFARGGADVVIFFPSEEEDDAKEPVRVVREAGRRCVSAPGDVREESYCRQLV